LAFEKGSPVRKKKDDRSPAERRRERVGEKGFSIIA